MKSKYITIITALLSLGLVTGCLNVKVCCDCKQKHHEGKESEEGEENEEGKDKKHHHEKEKEEDEDKDEKGEKGEKESKNSNAALKAKAKLTEAQARKIAMARVPKGTIKEGELEMENGKLQWSFDMTTPDSKKVTEVNIDAITGKIIAVAQESAEDEAKEAEAEKKEKGEK